MTTLTDFENALANDWQKVIAFIGTAEHGTMAFLSKVATGVPVLIEDIESIADFVAGKLGVINSTIAAVGAVADTIAPNNPTVAKVVGDLQTGATDVAAMSAALSGGSSSGDDKAVTTAVTAINAVNSLSVLAGQAAALLAQAAAAAPAATQVVSPPTPPQA
jgi:hypothetical protein